MNSPFGLYGTWTVLQTMAWLPTHTLDEGWVWLRSYWHFDHVWGWGFRDVYRYVDREKGPQTNNGVSHD